MNPDVAVSKELQVIAKEINARLEAVAGQPMAFSLLVFQAVEGSRMNYVSNCTDRNEVSQALKSLLKGWSEGMPDIKAHEVI